MKIIAAEVLHSVLQIYLVDLKPRGAIGTDFPCLNCALCSQSCDIKDKFIVTCMYTNFSL